MTDKTVSLKRRVTAVPMPADFADWPLYLQVAYTKRLGMTRVRPIKMQVCLCYNLKCDEVSIPSPRLCSSEQGWFSPGGKVQIGKNPQIFDVSWGWCPKCIPDSELQG